MPRVAVELANQPLTIFDSALRQIVDKGFDLITAGITQGGSATVVSSKGLDETSIQLVLANQQAKTVAEARLAVMMAIVSVRGSLGLIGRFGRLGFGGQPSSSTEQSPMP